MCRVDPGERDRLTPIEKTGRHPWWIERFQGVVVRDSQSLKDATLDGIIIGQVAIQEQVTTECRERGAVVAEEESLTEGRHLSVSVLSYCMLRADFT